MCIRDRQWTGSECSPLGDPIHSVLHCTAVVEFPADDAPVAPADTTPPTVSLTSPSAIEPAAPVTITGGFSDTGSGVESVSVSITRLGESPNLYWTGASWAANTVATALQATVDGSGAWALPGVDLSVAAAYELSIQATDAAGNTSSPLSSTITVGAPTDTTPPVVTSVTPADGTTVPAGPVDVTVQATDPDSGVKVVRIRIRNNTTGQYWNGISWVTNWSWVIANNTATGWTVPVNATDPGDYTALVWAWDNNDNRSSAQDNPQTTFTNG